MHTVHKAALAAVGLLASLCVPGVTHTAQATTSAGTATATPDHPAALTRYYDQRPAWHRCDKHHTVAYQCAHITVPLDYNRPTGPTLRLKISHIRTSTPGRRHGVLLSDPGGPGAPGLDEPLRMKADLSKIVKERYDLVGFDPRGLATSSPLHCGLTWGEVSPMLHPYRAATFAKDTARARDIAAKCTARNSAVLPYINTRNTARDMDVIRGVLGEKKISYFGLSYGTYLGAVYTQLFPERSDRVVLDSAVDPNHFGRGAMQAWATGTEPAFRDWSRLIARRDGTYHLGDTAAKVRDTFRRLVTRADRTPLLYEGKDVEHQGMTLTGADIRDWLREEFFNAPYQAAREIVALRKSETARPDPSSDGGRAASVGDNTTGLLWAVLCGDNSATWPRDPATYRSDARRDSARYPLYGDFAANITPCAFWPRGSEPATHVDNTVGALVVQNQWDSQTPLTEGLAMHRALHGSRLVYVRGGRGHGVYGIPGTPACATRAVDAYLVGGRLPAHDVTCHA
ncbi:alpha/beta hydrolase [Streptomyces fulvoviolaceus]|uniref:alpha/beta hydrolase n=1 Tax=Streptomyces fulvoviolaceus TaxID=285535 RepID=UPI0021C215C5|nr:alpha/beta hydrolase [Streptomyces fulvoviolaceus]MCT9082587.1 alpha/beta hydrolase [Streptomyces fulvoviolaceus]